jgi:predicted O-linked N-acetylglucosamine transferase (SPINDLY family)
MDLISELINDCNYKAKDPLVQKILIGAKSDISPTSVSQDQINELLQSYNKIDIALDTFPYNGGTTSLEASWMCVPILTLQGNKFISRCGYSINKNLNMSDWIATNENDYINKAILHSKDINELNKIRLKLQESSRKTALFDSSKFANDFVFNIINIWNSYKKS